jgi:hypothetical protein
MVWIVVGTSWRRVLLLVVSWIVIILELEIVWLWRLGFSVISCIVIYIRINFFHRKVCSILIKLIQITSIFYLIKIYYIRTLNIRVYILSKFLIIVLFYVRRVFRRFFKDIISWQHELFF